MSGRIVGGLKTLSTPEAQRQFSLKLYKAILKANKLVLPDVMRQLGDA